MLFFVAAMLQHRKILTAIRIFCKNIASTSRRVYTYALFCKVFCRRILQRFLRKILQVCLHV